MTVAYYFCNSHNDGGNPCNQILRSLVLQLLRQHLDLPPHVCENYTNRGYNPSMQQLRKLLPELLDTIPAIRIIIDGLDECQEKMQKQVMQELLCLCTSSDGHCKILFSSREVLRLVKLYAESSAYPSETRRKTWTQIFNSSLIRALPSCVKGSIAKRWTI